MAHLEFCESCRHYGFRPCGMCDRLLQASRAISKAAEPSRNDFLSTWDESAEGERSYADVSLKAADGPPVRAHKFVLASRSAVLKAAFDPSMTQGNSGYLSMPEMSHVELEAFVDFLYKASVRSETLNEHAPSLMCAAHKYDVKLLKSVCESHLKKVTSQDNCIKTFELGQMCESDVVEDAALEAAMGVTEDLGKLAEYDHYRDTDPKVLVQFCRILVSRMQKPSSAAAGKRPGKRPRFV